MGLGVSTEGVALTSNVRDWGVFRIHVGDCLDSLRAMPDASVHCCVTSPPYFGLRDYGVAGQIGLEPTPHPKTFEEAQRRLGRQVEPQPVIPLY